MLAIPELPAACAGVFPVTAGRHTLENAAGLAERRWLALFETTLNSGYYSEN